MKKLFFAFSCLIFLFTTPLFCQEPGELDPTFGDAGQFTFHFGADFYAYDVAVQNDGKIVIVGTVEYASGQDIFVMRLTENGGLDPGFQSTGFTSFPATESDYEVAKAVAIKSNKILIAGYSNFQGFMARLNSDGSLDTSFGLDGIQTIPQLSFVNDFVTIPGINTYDIFAVGGYADGFDTKPGMVKIYENGSLSASFGTDGLATPPSAIKGIFTSVVGGLTSVTAGGTWYPATGNDENGLFAKFNLSGVASSSFGSDGYVLIDGPVSGQSNNVMDMYSDFGGNITFCGRAMRNEEFDAYAGRLNTNGGLDESFGTSGFYTGFPNEDDHMDAITAQPDGNIIIGGTSDYNGDYDFNLARLLPNGEIDEGFGNDSWQLTDFDSSDDEIEAMVIVPDDFCIFKLIAVGNSEKEGASSIAVARYFLFQCVPVNDLDLKAIQLKLFPNPVTGGHFNLNYTLEASGFVNISLCSMDGKILHQFSSIQKYAGDNTESFEIPDHYPAGHYLLQFKLGEKNGYQKITVQ